MAYTKAVNPRSQSKRERFRQAVLRRDGPYCRMPTCVMPNRAIDLTLKAPARGSYTADHIIEIDTLRRQGLTHLYFDPTNGRPAHLACNSSAGATYGNRNRTPVRKIRRAPLQNTPPGSAIPPLTPGVSADPPPPPGW